MARNDDDVFDEVEDPGGAGAGAPPAPPPPPAIVIRGSTTAVAGATVDEGKGRIFPCEGCGADLEFHIGQQGLRCPFCGFEKELDLDPEAAIREQDFHAMLSSLAQRRREKHRDTASADDLHEVKCGACGATVVFRGALTSSSCAFCDVPVQREGVHAATERIAVDAVLPFSVEEQAARRNLAAWVKSRWFAPNDFKRRGAEGKFRGVYLPYWTYDAMTATAYRGERGEHYWVTVGSGKNRRRVRRTRWYPASGHFQRFFDDVLVLAAKGLPEKHVQELEPWPLEVCVPFTQQVLAGMLAQTYEIDLDEGFVHARSRIDAAIHLEVRRRIGGDEQRVHSIQTTYGAITYKHVLLPLWLLTYRFRDRLFRVVVNAGTGEVQGERPWSWIKITLAVLAGLAAAGAVAAVASVSGSR